jgi:putative redox protein
LDTICTKKTNRQNMNVKTTAKLGSLNYLTSLSARAHHFLGDEPHEDGGLDAGPSPFELVAWGLGECTAVTLRMYAARKEWDLGEITVHVAFDTDIKPAQIDIRIETEHRITDEQHQRLSQIAHKCPVHKFLMGEKAVSVSLNPAQEEA